MILKSFTSIFFVTAAGLSLNALAEMAPNAESAFEQDFAKSCATFPIPNANIRLWEKTSWAEDEGELKEAIQKCESTNGTFDPKNRAMDTAFLNRLCNLIQPVAKFVASAHPDFKQKCEFVEFKPCSIIIIKQVSFQFPAEVSAARQIMKYSEGEMLGFGRVDKNGKATVTPWHRRAARKNIEATEYGTIAISCRPVALLGVQPRWACASDKHTAWWAADDAYSFFPFRDMDPKNIIYNGGITKLPKFYDPPTDDKDWLDAWLPWHDEDLYRPSQTAKFLKKFAQQISVMQ